MTQRRETPDIMGAVLAGSNQPMASSLRIADIRRDGGTQPRAGLDESHVADLVAALAAGDTLPPVDVMHDGSNYWLYDGYHRVEAASRVGRYTVMATIHQGDQVAAQWASYAANGKHGLKRTNEDKRRAVLAALRHANAATMSNVQIAAHVGVDEGTVRNYREKLETASEIPKVTERTGADGKVYSTANIGANRPAPEVAPAYATVAQLEEIVRETAARWYRDETPAYAVSDMRAAASVRGGGFWMNCIGKTDPPQWREVDLAMAIRFVADEMARPPAATPGAVFAPNGNSRPAPPPAPVNRRAELAAMLTAVADAAPEINALTGVDTVVLLASIQPLVAALANDSNPAPTLPAELAAAGWRLCTMRGKHYATVTVPSEQEPIKTMLRLDLAATIRDAEYMHRNLKIGVSA